ncbi:aldehyde dehydrogenase PutA [Aureobasidium pullulans]|uniref:Aldehyde dehydrogenase PutA n=1 Tax=Aureobasidium pullulans TaxID=5580 RepID=A0A4S8WLW2_AURPU|nr:aldehyde dehydrogenase PutA [Aureobasidium pullulans]THW25906.1 aldehyde dehydrogenase PutA [Aureobasidium pullulans]THW60267.1 aldehyde dehydrogenase PutA [Aureobasidium pullulans]
MPSTSIESAAVDGRARTPRFIQRQLANLHKAITTNAKIIQDAIVADTGAKLREAQLEIHLSISVVKELYDNFSVEEALSQEYRVARGQDWCDRNDAVGTIYLRPQSQNLVYSIVSPLANAIAAGNCVVIESNKPHQALSSKIAEIILQHLDRDTIAFVENLPEPPSKGVLLIDQTGEIPKINASSVHTPGSSARVVALVDRSSDIVSAASSIVQARTAFGGNSVYAPDIVLVNEFAMKEFVQAAKIALSISIEETKGQDITASQATCKIAGIGLTEKELRGSGANVVMRGDLGTIAIVEDRGSSLLQRKIYGACLILHSVRSLDDGIDLANLQYGTVAPRNKTLLACYHFGAPEAAKYTTQFIDSYASFVNHAPIELTVGPAAPIGFHPSATHRYRPAMFSVPKADCIAGDSASRSLASIFRAEAKAWSDVYEKQITSSLAPTRQKAGKVVGFFDQGLITGFVVFWVPVIASAVVGSGYGIRAGIRMTRS